MHSNLFTVSEEAKKIDELFAAASKGDNRSVDSVAQYLPKLNLDMAAQARMDAKKTDDPIRRKQILDAVDDLELLIPGKTLNDMMVC
jgi:hypothetical protein